MKGEGIMVNSINVGNTCVVSRDIPVGDQVAFRKGEQVLVEDISPNPERPECKYVVLSKNLQKRFQLSENDIISIARPEEKTITTMPTTQPAQPQQPKPQYTSEKQGFLQNAKDKLSSRKTSWIIIGGIAVLVIVGIVLGLVFGLGGEKGTTEKDGSSSTAKKKTESTKTFTNDNWGLVCSNPSRYEGSKVEGLVGKIFIPPEQAEGGIAIQMFADPEGSSENTIVYYFGTDASQFANGDLIKVDGIVGEQFEGENKMGATLIVPTIAADSVTKTDASALITGGKEIPVCQQQNQHGIVVIVDKVVLQDNETDVFVRVSNQSGSNASFYDFNAKLQVGSQQLDPDSAKQYQYGSMSSEILPGVETSGILVFPSIGSPVPTTGSMALHLEAASDNYRLDFNPYVFNIAW